MFQGGTDLMSDFVLDAARTLAELAGTGAALAVQEASKEAGQSAAKKILGKIAGLLKKPEPDVADYEHALRAALADGTVQEDELRSLVLQAGSVRSESGIAQGNSTVNNTSDVAFINSVHNGPTTIHS
ncbi:hypothetical protein GCM10009741_11820 [Kribbella lupini]|uniref:Uncharacterized protein n=2 Tax=Kribbella lupini TaxID=291602 RepID=A0ABP4L2C2_9ACTN